MFFQAIMDLKKEVFLELRLTKAIETDANGNYIILAEASNENLDFEEQQVLRRALLDSKDYFLKNGLISYDHRHLKPVEGEIDWNPEKYIIGEPLDVFQSDDKTFVKALLYKSNALVQEIVQKLKDGATIIKASIGGKKPVIKRFFDTKVKRFVERVVSVLWDELAITFKPINQTLTPVGLSSKAFVKSLQAGYETDAAKLTGGQSIIPQDLEGAEQINKNKKNITAVVMALYFGDIKGPEETKQFLKNRGCSEEDATQILETIIQNKKPIKKAFKKILQEEDVMDSDVLEKSFDESIEELEKAMKKGKKAPKELPVEELPVEEPPVKPEEEEEEEEEEVEKGTKKSQPSVFEEVSETQKEFLDVSGFLKDLTKSISDKLDQFGKRLDGVEGTQEAIGKALGDTMKYTKSIADAPQPRKAVLTKSERKFLGDDGKEVTMNRDEILQKADKAVEKGDMSFREFTIIEDRLNRGEKLTDKTLRLLKAVS